MKAIKYLVIFTLISATAFSADLSKLIKSDNKGNVGLNISTDQVTKKLDDTMTKFQNDTMKKLDDQIAKLQKNIDDTLGKATDKINKEIDDFSKSINDEIIGKTKDLINQAEKEFNSIIAMKEKISCYITIIKIVVVVIILLFVLMVFFFWRSYRNIKRLTNEILKLKEAKKI